MYVFNTDYSQNTETQETQPKSNRYFREKSAQQPLNKQNKKYCSNTSTLVLVLLIFLAGISGILYI